MKWITAIWNWFVWHLTPAGTTSPNSNTPLATAPPSLGSGIYNNGGHEPGGTYQAEFPTDSKASVRWYGPGPSTPQMLASVDDNGVVTIDWSVCEEVAKLELGLATEVRLWETIAVARMLLAVRDGTYKAKE